MFDKLTMQTKDLAQGNVEKIAKLFPNCVTESTDSKGHVIRSVNFEQLKSELSNDVVCNSKERYVFTWPGKNESQRYANAPSSSTLRPDRSQSVNFDVAKDVYIEGDNLEVLKLLRETYLGKIQVIYIDPPYNTGNDFVYADDFSMSSDTYQSVSGDFDSNGNKLVINSSSNGKFHTNWLNMIYPRILIARDLLKDGNYSEPPSDSSLYLSP